MAEDIGLRLRRIQGLAGKLEANDTQVSEMMRLRVADGLGAMAYGQYGGSFPDPTAGAVFDIHGDIIGPDGQHVPVRWRDHRPEDDIAEYAKQIRTAETALALADDIRRRYMSANMDIRNRLDPTDWCVVQWSMHIYEGHRRFKGNLCKICATFYDENGREPTTTEADYYHRHGRWPHKLWDPKERRAV